jgi:RNA polymerase sigma-70 factor (ECF subfamily)
VAVIGPVAAADVTQDALIRAWRELPTLRDPARFLPWVRRILVNRARDVARTQRRGVRELRLEAFDDGAGLPLIPDSAGRLDASADLHAALERLTVDQRSLLALHYAMGLSLREVGETLGIPVGTAKSRVNASLAMLRHALEDDGR